MTAPLHQPLDYVCRLRRSAMRAWPAMASRLSSGGAVQAAVEAQRVPKAGIEEGLLLRPLCLCVGP